MTDKEREEFLRIIENYTQKFSKDKIAAQKFLIDVGIFTKSGKLSRNYKHLCIPQEPA